MYAVTNSDRTIETTDIKTRQVALTLAEEQADAHDEPFYVSGPDIETDPDDLGEQVDPCVDDDARANGPRWRRL